MDSLTAPQRGKHWKVLDHGYVQLMDFMGKDETIIEAARMSTGRGFERWDAGELCTHCFGRREVVEGPNRTLPCTTQDLLHPGWRRVNGDASLLEFLWENQHATPFEMCELHLEVQAPIFVFREWMRHRTMSFNEMSARYIQMPDIHYLPALDRIQKQSKANKQGSAEVFDKEYAQEIVEGFWAEQYTVYKHYGRLIEDGVAKEVARINTPVSRYSRMRVKTDLRNWLAFLKLRMAPNAQYEIRVYAELIGREIIAKLWPRTWELFEEHTLGSTTFSRSEMVVLKKILDRSETLDALKEAYQSGMSEKRFEKFLKKLGLIVPGKEAA